MFNNKHVALKYCAFILLFSVFVSNVYSASSNKQKTDAEIAAANRKKTDEEVAAANRKMIDEEVAAMEMGMEDGEEPSIEDEEALDGIIAELGDEINKPVIRYCDFEKLVATPVFNEISEKSTILEKSLKTKADDITARREKLEQDQVNYSKQEASYNDATRAEKAGELQRRATRLYEEMNKFQMEMQKETGGLYARATEIAKEVSKEFCQDEKKYDIIVQTILPGNPEYDVTQEIIDRANEKFKQKSKVAQPARAGKPAQPAMAVNSAQAAQPARAGKPAQPAK